LEEAFREWGSRRARLAVVEDNRGALEFWDSVGFTATGEVRDYRAGLVESRLVLMEKNIRAGDDTDASRVSR
jgi:ribosomal protein S18 acetylase RimI-like enzyme